MVFFNLDVLTAGHGPPGCRQTMTMAEENVFCCTSTRMLNTDHPQRLQFQLPVPEVPDPLRSKLKTQIPRTVTTSEMDLEIDSKSPTKRSRKNKSNAQHKQTAINTELPRVKIVSCPPIINTQEDHPVKQSHRAFCPIVTRDTVNPLQFIINNLQDLFRRDMDMEIRAWRHLQMNTPTPAVSWQQPQEIHSLQIHSRHRHPQLQRTIASCHHHRSRPAPAKSIPRLKVCLVTLLLIGCCPPVLRVPGIVSVQHQLHRFLQQKIDSPPRNDFWHRQPQFMTQRISNVTRHHPPNDYLLPHRQFWEISKMTDVSMPLVRTRITQNLEFHRKDWYPPPLYMHQYRKDLPESLPTGISSNHQYTIDIKPHRVIATDLPQYHQSRKDFYRVLQIQRVHIKDIPRAREFCPVRVHQISLGGILVRREAPMTPVRNTSSDRVRLRCLQILPVDSPDSRTLDRDLSLPARGSTKLPCNVMVCRGLRTDICRMNDTWRLVRLHMMAKWSTIRTGELLFVDLCQ